MEIPVDPGWLTLLPPLVAIALALIFREVIISLFAGVWLGALLLNGWDPGAATLRSLDQFILGTVAGDEDHVSIMVFSLLLGGMVGVMSRSGGTRGIVEALRPFATSARRAQFFAWLAGIIIFFDDYANTLIVGNTMRPVTDRLRVSREKLAYIVDSTAAPMAAIAVISTWVGYEISLIGDSLKSAAAQATDPALNAQLLAAAQNPFNVFLHSIPYLFYPIFALLFVVMTVAMRRDFGPMWEAERRARVDGLLLAPGAKPAAELSAGMDAVAGGQSRWYYAILPIAAVVVAALVGIWSTGRASLGEGTHRLSEIVGEADPFKTLIWASAIGCIVAIGLAVGGKALKLRDAMDAWVNGMRAIFLAIIILVLAWALGDVTEALKTGAYLAQTVSDALPLWVLPVLVFFIGALISFATGTSWGTMAILFPVVIPLAVAMGAGANFGEGENYTILLGVISSVMAGSIFGDHCSPISDTTIMSSMASACDHIDHVRTQLPYAIAVAVIAMVAGDIPTSLGLHPAIALVIGIVLLYLLLRFAGKSTDFGDAPVVHTDVEVPREAGAGI